MNSKEYFVTEYEEKMVENFMICGIAPDVIWSNVIQYLIGKLLTKELNGHKLDVLFSYPESETNQNTVLSVLLNAKNSIYFLRILR